MKGVLIVMDENSVLGVGELQPSVSEERVLHEMNDRLKKIEKSQKKLLAWAVIATVLALLVTAFCVFMGLKVISVENTFSQLAEEYQPLIDSLSSLDVNALSETVAKLGSVDFDSIISMLEQLQTIDFSGVSSLAGTLQNIFGAGSGSGGFLSGLFG